MVRVKIPEGFPEVGGGLAGMKISMVSAGPAILSVAMPRAGNNGMGLAWLGGGKISAHAEERRKTHE